MVGAAAKSDYYSVLNVSREASLQEIKASYRRLARKYHPDMNRGLGTEEKFKEIGAAYEVLSDDEKRSIYDRFGEAGLQGEYEGTGVGSQDVDPFEVFDAFFGESNGIFGGMRESGDLNFNLRNSHNQSLDIRYDLFLTFHESVFGGTHDIEVLCFDACNNCNGTGAKSSNCIKQCSDCRGRGGLMKTQRTPFGIMSQVSTCTKCGGDGKIVTDHCPRCSGQGNVKSKREFGVVIPPGVSDGATMQFQGEGNRDEKSGVVGDLLVVLHIEEERGIQRDGLNLYSKIAIDYTEAILGTVTKVKTIEGLKDLRIPSGIQPGDTVKISRMGVPDVNNPFVRGDHIFVVNILIPKDLSVAERTLVEKLASLKATSEDQSQSSNGLHHCPSQPSTRAKSLWSSMKAFLRQKQSSEGFASVAVDTSGLLWRCSERDSSLLFGAFLVVMVTYFTTVVRNTVCSSQKKSSLHSVRAKKDQH